MNVHPSEIAKFSAQAADWWNDTGAFRTLHQINPVRLAWIKTQVPCLAGARVLDVGCGGGILSEALAKEGAQVTGLDLAAASLDSARLHAIESEVTIDYRCESVEDHAAQSTQRYDVITCMELLEHVPDPFSILQHSVQLLSPQGCLLVSTINRTPQAYWQMIVAAERVLRWVPQGTHQHSQFIRPSELGEMGDKLGLSVQALVGLTYQPWRGQFTISPRVDVNYLMAFTR